VPHPFSSISAIADLGPRTDEVVDLHTDTASIFFTAVEWARLWEGRNYKLFLEQGKRIPRGKGVEGEVE